MTNDVQSRLATALAGRYTVVRELGAGGMATVYLARDERHDREVAVKVLHPDLGAALGADRFLAEIKTTAKLQHPHILPLIDSGVADGLLYYVMPFVTGETLRARLERERQLPIADAVRVAREVAGALEHAHRQGIIHRDIKPENILLQDGAAVVADFGIALAVQSAGGQRMTQTGLSLGTPSYMSPEQAMGERIIDARSDVYALGAVSYEMLTGDPPFSGNSVQAIVAKVLNERPAAPRVLRDTIPTHVEAAVLQALAKLPADRFASAAEFGDALTSRDATSTAALQQRDSAGVSLATRSQVRRWQGIAVVCALFAISASAMLLRPRATPPLSVVRFTLPAAAMAVGRTQQPAVSPDGRVLAFADRTSGAPGIRVRWLDRQESELVPGTQGAGDVAFSPDGRMLAYVGDDFTVRVVSLDGRTSTLLAKDASYVGGVDWDDDGYVYYSSEKNDGPLWRVAATGGTPEPVVPSAPEGVNSTGGGWMRSPFRIPGTSTLLFSVSGSANGDSDIVAFDVKAKSRRVIGRGLRIVGQHDDWVLVARLDGTVHAVRFDPSSSAPPGDAIPVLNGVYSQDGSSFIALGRSGTLLYQPASSAVSHLAWVTRDGAESDVDSSLARPIQNVAIAPQGTRVAMSVEETNGLQSIWVYDFARRTMTRLTRSGVLAYRPVWSSDGQRLAFSGQQDESTAVRSLWTIAVDRADTARVLVRSKRHVQEVSWPASGRVFAYREGFSDANTLRDIYVMTEGDTVGRPLIATAADEFNPSVSPDGKWLAYTSTTSGRNEVYVTPFPNGGARYPVSTDGGSTPVWSRTSKQLYYRSAKARIITVEMNTAAANPVGPQRVLFDASRYSFDEYGKSYDVAPNDDRFLFIKPPPRASLAVVTNWWQEAGATLAKARR